MFGNFLYIVRGCTVNNYWTITFYQISGLDIESDRLSQVARGIRCVGLAIRSMLAYKRFTLGVQSFRERSNETEQIE